MKDERWKMEHERWNMKDIIRKINIVVTLIKIKCSLIVLTTTNKMRLWQNRHGPNDFSIHVWTNIVFYLYKSYSHMSHIWKGCKWSFYFLRTHRTYVCIDFFAMFGSIDWTNQNICLICKYTDRYMRTDIKAIIYACQVFYFM